MGDVSYGRGTGCDLDSDQVTSRTRNRVQDVQETQRSRRARVDSLRRPESREAARAVRISFPEPA